jgi:hypothetical protein
MAGMPRNRWNSSILSDNGTSSSNTNGTHILQVSRNPMIISKMATRVRMYPVSEREAIKSAACGGGCGKGIKE